MVHHSDEPAAMHAVILAATDGQFHLDAIDVLALDVAEPHQLVNAPYRPRRIGRRSQRFYSVVQQALQGDARIWAWMVPRTFDQSRQRVRIEEPDVAHPSQRSLHLSVEYG